MNFQHRFFNPLIFILGIFLVMTEEWLPRQNLIPDHHWLILLLSHIGTALFVSIFIFFLYEKKKSEDKDKKLVNAILSLFVSEKVKGALTDILENSKFVKTDFLAYYILEVDKDRYTKIVQYDVQNTTDEVLKHEIRTGYGEKMELKEFKVSGAKVLLEKMKKISENDYGTMLSSLHEIPPRSKITVVFRYTSTCEHPGEIDSSNYALTPSEKTTVKIRVLDDLDHYEISVTARSKNKFKVDPNFVSKTDKSYVLDYCLLPYQGFHVSVKRKNS